MTKEINGLTATVLHGANGKFNWYVKKRTVELASGECKNMDEGFHQARLFILERLEKRSG
jgi:homospermidine synthase